MKRKEFTDCVKMAASEAHLPPYLSLTVFDGCAFDSKQRFVTREQVASLIRGECITFGGEILHRELEEVRLLSKRFTLVG
jgi:hypothetical protein